jgi:beta-phosphoglucomutase-like phosphatase (HAD superfamily)
VVVVNPSYVFGAPVDRSQPGETSTRMIGNYLRGRLPAVVDARTNIVDVRDVAKGHLLAAERGRAGERYVLGGHDVGWVELLQRVAELSGVHYPLMVLPPEAGAAARAAESLGLPSAVAAEGIVLMAQNWTYSSAKAKRELGYRARTLDRTLRDTIEWYRELLDAGLGGGRPSAMSLAAAGVRLAVTSNSDGSVADLLARHEIAQVGPGPGVEVEHVSDSGALGVAKPHPAIFAATAAGLDLPPGRIAHVGDSGCYDADGATGAGMVGVHVDPLGLCPQAGHAHVISLAAFAAGLLDDD